ncbi:MAG: 3'-5' exonuclease domain-containing protein 2 [Bacteroidia bacterium]|nr:3'-5' exonuclease domain-containing protein 2 [Bacteroidia bacterium]
MSQVFTTMKKCISNDELAELPLSSFEGVVHVIEQPEDLGFALEYLSSQSILGFDTETRPAFKKGQIYPVSLLQLSTSDQAFLFRINKIGLPVGLIRILASPKILKIGVAIRDDIKILQRIVPFKPSGFVELQDLVKNYGIENFSLKKLSALVLGFRISKSQRLTNWDAQELSEQQMIYGATDAWVSCEIYKQLLITPIESVLCEPEIAENASED